MTLPSDKKKRFRPDILNIRKSMKNCYSMNGTGYRSSIFALKKSEEAKLDSGTEAKLSLFARINRGSGLVRVVRYSYA